MGEVAKDSGYRNAIRVAQFVTDAHLKISFHVSLEAVYGSLRKKSSPKQLEELRKTWVTAEMRQHAVAK